MGLMEKLRQAYDYASKTNTISAVKDAYNHSIASLENAGAGIDRKLERWFPYACKTDVRDAVKDGGNYLKGAWNGLVSAVENAGALVEKKPREILAGTVLAAALFVYAAPKIAYAEAPKTLPKVVASHVYYQMDLKGKSLEEQLAKITKGSVQEKASEIQNIQKKFYPSEKHSTTSAFLSEKYATINQILTDDLTKWTSTRYDNGTRTYLTEGSKLGQNVFERQKDKTPFGLLEGLFVGVAGVGLGYVLRGFTISKNGKYNTNGIGKGFQSSRGEGIFAKASACVGNLFAKTSDYVRNLFAKKTPPSQKLDNATKPIQDTVQQGTKTSEEMKKTEGDEIKQKKGEAALKEIKNGKSVGDILKEGQKEVEERRMQNGNGDWHLKVESTTDAEYKLAQGEERATGQTQETLSVLKEAKAETGSISFRPAVQNAEEPHTLEGVVKSEDKPYARKDDDPTDTDPTDTPNGGGTPKQGYNTQSAPESIDTIAQEPSGGTAGSNTTISYNLPYERFNTKIAEKEGYLPTIVDDVIRMYESIDGNARTYKVRDICDEFGMSNGQLYRILDKNNVERRINRKRKNVEEKTSGRSGKVVQIKDWRRKKETPNSQTQPISAVGAII